MQDIFFTFQWWLALLGIGIIFLPLSSQIFRNFFDLGYVFSKVLGYSILSYTVFIIGTLHILKFNNFTVYLFIWIFLLVNIFILWKKNLFNKLKNKLFIIIFEELIFLISLIFWSFVRSHEPSIHGLEKFMDFGFINSILRADYFPPKDMWFTPFSINYYYFGHLITAVLTKLSGIPSNITYNLMLSTIFAFTFTLSFSIGANLIKLISKPKILNPKQIKNSRLKFFNFKLQFLTFNFELFTLFSGLLTAFLVSLAGNIHSIYTLFKPYTVENPQPFWELVFSIASYPNNYWYPNATRFIYNTIHEFPIYSFVVSDLHGHVLSIPIILTIIAILLNEIFNVTKIINIKKIILLSFLIAIAYMTNAWDGIIYTLLSTIVILYLLIKNQIIFNKIKTKSDRWQTNFKLHTYNLKFNFFNKIISLDILSFMFYFLLLLVGFFIFTLPFSLSFKPFVSGIGVVCAPDFLTNIGKIGPLLFEKDHCQRSPWWQLIILYGFFYFWVFSFAIIILKKLNNLKNGLTNSDIFVFLLIIISTILIIIPEFIYAKDIYPAHYRANTMFKLVYQSFIMLSISSAYIIIRIMPSIKNQLFQHYNASLHQMILRRTSSIFYVLISMFFIFLVATYPNFAINSYYGNLFKSDKKLTLDGTIYLNNIYSSDYEAIKWLNKNIKGQPVILEAQGDSYTDYARVSANTGLPTVLGWTVHEWLWRGTYDIPSPRIAEVQNLYETDNLTLAKELLKKHNVELVFIGDLERQKYPNLNSEKLKLLGRPIYQNGQTIIYKIK